jgi:hypothetical protein
VHSDRSFTGTNQLLSDCFLIGGALIITVVFILPTQVETLYAAIYTVKDPIAESFTNLIDKVFTAGCCILCK